jgi:D-3-phosphoglycerate dehydrogenase / 2-oxoglutarate reductase
MRILIADALAPAAVKALTESGHESVVDPALTGGELPERISGFAALVVRSTKVTAATIEAGESLELIIRAGAGTNTIDTQAAADVGIYVTNVPGRNALAVAELTMGLLLAIDRRIADNVADLRDGKWNKKTYGDADGVFGKTMGVIGLGDIGLAVAERASAFGLVVRAVRKDGRSPATEERIRTVGIELVGSTDELLQGSDIVTLHVPATDETIGMVDGRFLELLPERAILLNTSRGDLIDETALLEAIDAKGLRVGLDVYPDEPGSSTGRWSSKLAEHPNVVGTHHIGASTEQAQRAIAAGVVEIVNAFQRGEILHCVNLEQRRLGRCTLHVRHYDRVGVLAQVFDLLRRSGLNVEQMENRIFAGGNAAVATIDVGDDLSRELLAQIDAIPDVIHVSVVTVEEAG